MPMSNLAATLLFSRVPICFPLGTWLGVGQPIFATAKLATSSQEPKGKHIGTLKGAK
jgi:hypothetical protein